MQLRHAWKLRTFLRRRNSVAALLGPAYKSCGGLSSLSLLNPPYMNHPGWRSADQRCLLRRSVTNGESTNCTFTGIA